VDARGGRRDHVVGGGAIVIAGSRALVSLTLLLLVGATVYEAVVAFEVVELGSLAGEGAVGAEVFGWLAAVGLLAAALLCALLLACARDAPALAAFLAPAAGAFLLAYFHTFDPYYLPSLIRYSERDFVPPALVYVLTAAAFSVGLVTFLRPRPGLILSAPAILACGLAAWWSGLGH
jgi:hypothetical protein